MKRFFEEECFCILNIILLISISVHTIFLQYYYLCYIDNFILSSNHEFSLVSSYSSKVAAYHPMSPFISVMKTFHFILYTKIYILKYVFFQFLYPLHPFIVFNLPHIQSVCFLSSVLHYCQLFFHGYQLQIFSSIKLYDSKF